VRLIRKRSIAAHATAAALALALVASGCGGGSDGDTGSSDATVSIAAEAEPATLDLTTTPAAAIPRILLYNVYEGLVKLDGEGKVQPLLAKDWQVSADRKTYTFHLQSNAKFSNGKQLTAADAVWSIDRVRAAGSKHPFKSQMAVVKSATAKDATTLVVQLTRPSNSWLYNMANPVGIIFSKDAVGTLATKPVGSGPFVFKDWTRGSALTLSRNESYWGAKAKVATVVFRFYTDTNAAINALLSNQLDVIANVRTPESIAQLKGKSDLQIVEGTTNGEVVMSMNNARGPLKDWRVRQAIIQAIDRKKLVQTVSAGYGKLIGSMVPPTDPWYEDLSNHYPYDPPAAKKLLKEAGYPNGLSLGMQLPTRPDALASGRFAAAQLKQVGITAKITQLEFPARWLDVVLTKGDYDISIIAHVEPRDIEKFTDPTYYFHYNNPKAKALLDAADTAPPGEQATYMKRLARQLTDDAAANWLYLQPSLEVLRKGISGYPENAATLSYDMTEVEKA
jgi:peptide/nickel transport system substrate-binding protein